ncbi:AimR family lysis-lysogeny pheromone receptor [Bacillus sp. JJ722]|uniref:AimR family lysis-lysogeny pheromone receptor n=1 Tax=Bacillus sp. JJ722 TaxID=3122973 RepID=UPI002FFF905B
MCILKRILNKKSSDDSSLITNLAKEIGCASSSITKFKNEENKEFHDFEGLVKMVKFLDEDNEFEIMMDYSTNIDVNSMSARTMLDYLSVNRQFDAMNSLIERIKQTSNSESKPWVEAYSLLYLWQIQAYELDLDKFLNEVNGLNTKNFTSLEILQRLLKCYAYDLKKDHKQVFEISEEIKILINNVKEKYLKRVFSVKLYEVLSNINLWVFYDADTSRFYAMKVIEANIGNAFNSYAYYIIAQSYFYNSYDISKQFFVKSIDGYKSFGRNEVAKDIEETLELLEVFWGQKDLNENFLLKKNELYK